MPLLVRWPGTIKPNSKINGMISHMDWMPTLLAAAGEPNVKEKLMSKDGYKANGKDWRVKLAGYNYIPYFKGEVKEVPRTSYVYWDQAGNLSAIRWTD